MAGEHAADSQRKKRRKKREKRDFAIPLQQNPYFLEETMKKNKIAPGPVSSRLLGAGICRVRHGAMHKH